MTQVRSNRSAVWPAFVWTSIALAISAGFGLGAALFAVQALGFPSGAWWPAAGQAHGHVQLFGWAGLMVLGVGFHFLPRLRGAPLLDPPLTHAVLALLAGGLALRAVTQPLFAADPGGVASAALGTMLVLSGALQLAGIILALGVLARSLRHGPPLRERTAFWQVLPFLATAFLGLWLALASNALGLFAGVTNGSPFPAPAARQLTILLALHAFLLPMAIAMSSRTFPLYFRTRPPRLSLLRAGLALLWLGILLRATDTLIGPDAGDGLGRISQAAAFGLFVLGLGVFGSRRPLPHQPVRPLADPIHLHVLSAYLWLAFAAMLLALSGAARLGLAPAIVAADAEVHALGAGFVTLLILGVGAHMLPGFSGRPLRSRRGLLWATLVLANAAVVLRLAPAFAPLLMPTPLATALAALAGLSGLTAIALFAANLAGGPVRRGSIPLPMLQQPDPDPQSRQANPAPTRTGGERSHPFSWRQDYPPGRGDGRASAAT